MKKNHRILVVDDDPKILQVYTDVLTPGVASVNSKLQDFTGVQKEGMKKRPPFDVTMASQGKKGVQLVHAALLGKRPFAAAFIDVRMPPGIDGVETARRIRELDDAIHIFIVSAYSDRSVDDIQEEIVHDVLLAKKPLSHDEIYQMARNACNCWNRDRLKEEKVEKRKIEVVQLLFPV